MIDLNVWMRILQGPARAISKINPSGVHLVIIEISTVAHFEQRKYVLQTRPEMQLIINASILHCIYIFQTKIFAMRDYMPGAVLSPQPHTRISTNSSGKKKIMLKNT